MASISERLRHQVRERAHGRCEYCLITDEDAYYPHEPDHVIAEKHGGATNLENLTLACFSCNRHKGSDIASLDPLTHRITLFFNPRQQQWKRHFRLNGVRIEPLTACGRVTERLLQLNNEESLAERLKLMKLGQYPG